MSSYFARNKFNINAIFSIRKRVLRHFCNEIKRPDNFATAGTMSEINIKMMDRIGLEPGYNPIPRSREHLIKYQPSPADLPPRTMADSFTSAVIPLSSSKSLQDIYSNYLGNVRYGRLMQDMDLFAVWVCHQHLHIPSLKEGIHLPYTFVTIMLDKIDFTEFSPKSALDIRLSGHVSWVGKSSMEVVVWLEQVHHEAYRKITRAQFLMAARNATNTGPAPVNPITPGNKHEDEILSGGEERKKRRMDIQKQSLLKVVPNNHEQSIMHELFTRIIRKDTIQLNKKDLPPNGKWMADCSIMNTIPCFPEYRNAQNTVFGGFILKTALESSWVSAYLHAKHKPKLETIWDITFEKPVDVSSFLQMNAYVTYTQSNYMVVMVVADCLRPTGGMTTSNVMYYVWKFTDVVPEVIPGSYHEMMWYLMGRRKLIHALNNDDIQK